MTDKPHHDFPLTEFMALTAFGVALASTSMRSVGAGLCVIGLVLDVAFTRWLKLREKQ